MESAETFGSVGRTRGAKPGGKYVVLVKVRAPTGVSVYYPLATTSPPSYPLPPPTTLAGALAYPYLREREAELEAGEYSPTILILDKIVYAAAGAEGWTMVRDTERVYQHVYLRPDYYERMEMAYTVGVRGVAFYLDDRLYLLYVLTDRRLADYAYGITRIGRKESLVSVDDVVVEELSKVVKSVGRGSFETYFYFPEEIAVCSNHEVVSMPKLDKANFGKTVSPSMESYCVSRGLGTEKVKGELKEGGALIRVEDFDIPIPRQVIDGDGDE